jgi:hypothetical protein
VYDVYKAKLKAQAAQERQERESEHARLLERVDQLERDREALRDVVRRQKHSLEMYKELLRAQGAMPAELPQTGDESPVGRQNDYSKADAGVQASTTIPSIPSLRFGSEEAAPSADDPTSAPTPRSASGAAARPSTALPPLRPGSKRDIPLVQVDAERPTLSGPSLPSNSGTAEKDSAPSPRPNVAGKRLVDALGEWDVIFIGGAPREVVEKPLRAVVEPVRRKKARENLPEVEDCPMVSNLYLDSMFTTWQTLKKRRE